MNSVDAAGSSVVVDDDSDGHGCRCSGSHCYRSIDRKPLTPMTDGSLMPAAAEGDGCGDEWVAIVDDGDD